MNEIIEAQATDVTAIYEEAVQLHQHMMANLEVAATSLLDVCKDLKKMRDEKLYIQLGYEDFESYCEKLAGIKSRMAYNYISTYEKLGPTFLQSNANLGITKLELISGMNPQERADKIESGEFGNMSVAEIKELIKKNKSLGEQVNLLNAENIELKNKPTEVIIQKKTVDNSEEVTALNEQLSSSNAEKERLQQKIKEINKKHKEEIEKAIADASSNPELIKKITDKASEDFKAQYDEQIKTYEKKTKDLEKEITNISAEKETLVKKLELADTDSAKAMVYIKAIQDDFNSLITIMNGMPQSANEKFKGAVLKLIATIKGMIESEA